jgi:putative transposase
MELNPVRAGLVREAQQWRWSSAVAHCGEIEADDFVEMETWRRTWSAASWRQLLSRGEEGTHLSEIRRSTHTGRPLGTAEFIEKLEKITQRHLTPGKGGRPKNRIMDEKQEAFQF